MHTSFVTHRHVDTSASSCPGVHLLDFGEAATLSRSIHHSSIAALPAGNTHDYRVITYPNRHNVARRGPIAPKLRNSWSAPEATCRRVWSGQICRAGWFSTSKPPASREGPLGRFALPAHLCARRCCAAVLVFCSRDVDLRARSVDHSALTTICVQQRTTQETSRVSMF